MLAAGIRERPTHLRSAIRRRIRIEHLRLKRDKALRRNPLQCTLNRLHHAIAPRQIRIADVERNSHAARDAVHRTWKNVAHADRGDGIGCSARTGRIFDCQDQLRGRAKCILAVRHQHSASVPSRTFNRNPKTRRRRDALHNSERSARAFEQRTLLDVQLKERFVITFRQFHILKVSVEPGFSANFIRRFAVAILQFRSRFRGKCSREQTASQAADAESRRFFRGEYEKFNRVLGPESDPLQRANCFESAENSNDAIVFAGIGNRINVRASSNSRRRRISPIPACKNISNGILADGESCFFAKRNHPIPRFQIRRRKNNSRDCGRLRVGNGGQRFYF